MKPDKKELALAREHPRGTEKRRIGAYAAALASPVAYAALPESDRDAMVRWAEARRRIRLEHGIDADSSNLVERLIPEAKLRALVIEGEAMVAAGAANVPELVEEAAREGLPTIVGRIRRAASDSD